MVSVNQHYPERVLQTLQKNLKIQNGITTISTKTQKKRCKVIKTSKKLKYTDTKKYKARLHKVNITLPDN